MRNKTIHIITIITAVLILGIESIFLWVFPNIVNNVFLKTDIQSQLKAKTDIDLKYQTVRIKTYPNLHIKTTIKNISVKKETVTILSADLIETEISLIKLLAHKLCIKNLTTHNLYAQLILTNENKIKWGNYDVSILLKKYMKCLSVKNSEFKDSRISIKNNLEKNEICIVSKTTNSQYSRNIIKLRTETDIITNKQPNSTIRADFAFDTKQLEFINNGTKENYIKINNLNLQNLETLIKSYNKELQKTTGIIDIKLTHNPNSDITIIGNLNCFTLQYKNPLNSIIARENILFNTNLKLINKTLQITKAYIISGKEELFATGKIPNITDYKKINELKLNIKNVNLKTIYELLPTLKNKPIETLSKLKKLGILATINGDINISGNIDKPLVYGNLLLNQIQISTKTPIDNESNIKVDLSGNKLSISSKLVTKEKQFVEINGKSEIKTNPNGEFYIESSPKVDLYTAYCLLVPIHELIGFNIGPVPYMQLKGTGNIKLHTKGNIINGKAYGKLNFENVTANLKGLNTNINNANGSLVFEDRSLHIYTTKAFIDNKLINIDGQATLDGNIDIKVNSKSFNIKKVLNILNTSEILKEQKIIASPIKNAYGDTEIDIKIKGLVNDYAEILKNNTLKISGKLNLKNVTAYNEYLPLPIHNIKGIINFDNTNFNTKLFGYLNEAPIKIEGHSTDTNTEIKIVADKIETDGIISLILQSNIIPEHIKTNSYITFNGIYKSKNQNFNPNKLVAQGAIKQKDKTNSIEMNNFNFILSNGTLVVKNFSAKHNKTSINANEEINNIFDPNKKYTINGNIDINNLDISILELVKGIKILPLELKNLLNTYTQYSGNIDLSIQSKNNTAKGTVNIHQAKFIHKYFKTPILIQNGQIILNGNKATFKSIIADIDSTPMYLNLTAWDLNKTAKLNGYLTTKVTENFINKYINSSLTYPIKINGDITLTTDIKGDLKELRIIPKIKLAPQADIYYMGANLGNESDEREIYADITMLNDNYYLIQKLNYIRYMKSQNSSTYPLVILNAKGVINPNKGILKNVYIETLNKANAKVFNIFFKKSVLKNGLFQCKLFADGTLDKPKILGNIKMENLDMPLYNTLIKNVDMSFNPQKIKINSSGIYLNSDFSVKAQMINKLQLPSIIENIDVQFDTMNIDSLINYLTQIPTPNTTTKLVDRENNITKNQFNIGDIIIKRGKIRTKEIKIKNITANNFESDFSLDKELILKIPNIKFDITTGLVDGSASYEFTTGKIKSNMSAFNVDSNKIATSFFEFKDQIFGSSNGHITILTKGKTEDERIKNLSGYVYFEIADGKMPKLGSVEYLLKASNLIKNGITGLSISNIIELIAPIKTGYFESIKGSFAIKNGIAQNIELYSKSENLNMFIDGDYDIKQQYANMRVYGRLTKKATNILGKIGNTSLNTLISQIPGIKLNNKNKTNIMKEINKIPGVEFNDEQYKIFTVKIDGNINDEKYVKNFRWIE